MIYFMFLILKYNKINARPEIRKNIHLNYSRNLENILYARNLGKYQFSITPEIWKISINKNSFIIENCKFILI